MNKWDNIFLEGTTFGPLNEIFLSALLEAVQKHIRVTAKEIIDLGYGDGDALVRFAKRRFKVVGFDFSEVALAKARQRLDDAKITNIDLRLIDLEEMIVQDKTDIVLCKLTYAFVENKERFLKNVKNLMKDNSVFILITPVLHKGVEYFKEDKPGIAVDFDETKDVLANHFSKVEVFHHNYLGARVDVTTFLCFA
ncbi:methyltransferase domain-containing protein [Candidatus Azambacteria bacterium]|nr:methyltransferase domain-containing protein [Candidatus Azambacteria bacterium]MBI3685349.1 methyltransferase domain-containing protein [Candidatus Azambacteria bacterium]